MTCAASIAVANRLLQLPGLAEPVPDVVLGAADRLAELDQYPVPWRRSFLLPAS
jgi:hypothetical protein